MKKRRFLSVVVSLLLVASLFLGACGDTDTSSDSTAAAETSVESTDETADTSEETADADAAEETDSEEDEAEDADAGETDEGDADTEESDADAEDADTENADAEDADAEEEDESLTDALQSTSAAASKNVINQNVSTKAASCNATKGSLPSGTTKLTGNTSYYFNIQISEDLKYKKAELYIQDVGASKATKVYTDSPNNYARYTYYKYKVANKSGTLKYYWKLTYTSGKTKTTSTKSVTVTKSSSITINQNVATKAVSCNASDGSLPSGTTKLTGNTSYYFNIQVSDNAKFKKAVLYIQDSNASSYEKVYTYTAKNYARYESYQYAPANKNGTLKYYWKLTWTDGTTKSTGKTSVTVTKSSTDTYPSSLYLKQAGDTTCTLACAAMVMRGKMYKAGSSSWSSVTESAIKSTAWVSGTGLRHSFTYKSGSNSLTVSSKSYDGTNLSTIKSLLKSHPEGIVLWCKFTYNGKSNTHAVFITRCVNDVLYCADPLSGYSGKEMKLTASSLGKRISTSDQTKILAKCSRIWYVSSATIK